MPQYRRINGREWGFGTWMEENPNRSKGREPVIGYFWDGGKPVKGITSEI